MKLYLNARRDRREEMRERRTELTARGHEVVSSWLDSTLVLDDDTPAALPGDAGGGHDAGQGSDMSLGDERGRVQLKSRIDMNRAKVAEAIYAEILDCEGMIVFTDAQNHTREEAYAEYGGALFQGKKIWIVGQRYHTLHHYKDVQQFDTWQEFLKVLAVLEAAERPETSRAKKGG